MKKNTGTEYLYDRGERKMYTYVGHLTRQDGRKIMDINDKHPTEQWILGRVKYWTNYAKSNNLILTAEVGGKFEKHILRVII